MSDTPPYENFAYKNVRVMAVYAYPDQTIEKREVCRLEDGSLAILSVGRVMWEAVGTEKLFRKSGWGPALDSRPVWERLWFCNGSPSCQDRGNTPGHACIVCGNKDENKTYWKDP